jgi:hypothetical protein
VSDNSDIDGSIVAQLSHGFCANHHSRDINLIASASLCRTNGGMLQEENVKNRPE